MYAQCMVHSVACEDCLDLKMLFSTTSCLLLLFLTAGINPVKGVLSSPLITTPPNNQSAVELETVQFSCQASGEGPPVISWWIASENGTLQAVIVPTENVTSIETETLMSSEVTSTLTLTSVYASYSGAIVCLAENSVGNDSALAILTVFVPASILAHPSNTTINVSESIHLVCVAYGHPPPLLTWKRENDVELPANANVTQAVKYVDGTPFVVSILEMCDLDSSSVGMTTYSCVASNNASTAADVITDERNFSIYVKGYPVTDYCPTGETVIPDPSGDGIDIVLEWPEMDIGVNHSIPCPCGNLTGGVQVSGVTLSAYRYCDGDSANGAQWWEPMLEACNFSSTTRGLCQITSFIDDPDRALQLARPNPEDIEALDVKILTKIFEKLAVAVLSEQNLTLATSLLTAVDNILEVDPQHIRKSENDIQAATRILGVVERIVESIPIPENETEVAIPFKSFAVSIREVEPADFGGQTFSIALDNITQIDEGSLSFGNQSMATASIELPDDLFSQITDRKHNRTRVRLYHTVYLTDSLFVRRRKDSFQVGSVIISASITGVDTVEGISDPPIKITFTRTLEAQKNNTNTSCTYWDFEADDGYGEWSTKGCELISETGDEVMCACDHLTNFALLLDVSPNARGGEAVKDVPEEVGKTLLAVSYIGAILSIIFLVITIATYSLSKKLRSTINGKLLINLCIGFLGIYVMFIVGYHATPVDVLCAIAGGLLHYFMLATFAIMAAEAISLYINLVVVLGWNTIKSYYTLKATLVSWIVPFIIVVISVGPNYKNYIGEQLCRPYGIPFYVALIGPFALVYIFNWTVFVIIIASLLKRSLKQKKRLKMNTDKDTSKSMLKRHLIISIGLSLLFGLGWGLGLPATSAISNVPLRIMLQVLFILFTGFQGVFIFIMQCARSEDARQEWARWIKILTFGKVEIKKKRRYTHSNTNPYKRSSSESRFSISTTLPRSSNTMVSHVQAASNSDTLRRILQPHYTSRSNLLQYSSQSSLVAISEDLKEHTPDPELNCEEKKCDLSIVWEDTMEMGDTNDNTSNRREEMSEFDVVWCIQNNFSNPLRGLTEEGGQYAKSEL